MSVGQPELIVDPNKNGLQSNGKIKSTISDKMDKSSKVDKEEVNNNINKEDNEIRKSPYTFDLNKEPESIDEMLIEVKKLLYHFLMGEVEETKFIFKQRAHVSFFYEMAVSFFDFLDSLLKLDKESLEKALHSVTATNESVLKTRKKIGIYGYLFRADFSKHSDIELYAEMAYAFSQIMNAFVIALLDQGVFGMVNAGLKAKTSYSSIKNCLYALEDKKEWESELSQKNFESCTRAFIGCYDLVVSFCPSKIAKVLDLIGFNSDRMNALQNIKKSYEIKDACVSEVILVVLLIHHLFLNNFFGIGEIDTKFICESTKKWDNVKKPKEAFLIFGKGSREMVLGNPKLAIELLEETVRTKGHYRQMTYLSYWQLVWSNCMVCDWKQAAKYAELLKDNCKWSSALFHYLHAIFLQQQMDLEGKKELKKSIEEGLSLIPKIKRNLGGKLAFHERLVLDRSKRYVNKTTEMLLPALELMYIWNIFNMMANDPELFNPIMQLIETKLNQLDKNDKKYLNKYCYLIFIRGVIFRHSNRKPEAIQCFEEIIKHDSKLTEKNLAPQACFEIGMVNYETNHFKESKKWLKKVKNLYSSYITQSLIDYRVQWTLDLIKNKKRNLLGDCES